MELQKVQSQIKKVIDNNIVRTIIIVLLVLYCSLLAPSLSPSIKRLFNNMLFRIVILSGIIILAHEDIVIALLFSVAFIITLDYANRMTKENMVNFPQCMNNCTSKFKETNNVKEYLSCSTICMNSLKDPVTIAPTEEKKEKYEIAETATFPNSAAVTR
jgi:hypothetical protein